MLRKLCCLSLAGVLSFSGLKANILDVKAVDGNVYYVSVNGNDDNNGSFEAPLKTIQRAVEIVKPGDTVYVREGIYDETVTFTNNGTDSQPITIESFENEQVVISGCDQITGWQQSDRDGIWKAPMDWSLGEDGNENQVFVNGKLMYEARYPNVKEGSTLTNFNYAKTKSGTGFVDSAKEKSKLVDSALTEFAKDNDFFDGAKIWMVPGYQWTALTSKVESYDSTTGTVIFPSTTRAKNSNYYDPTADRPYYIFGTYGLLDSENEWWYSNEEKMLYMKITDGANPDDVNAYVEAKKRNTGIDLSDSSYIHIEGIDLRGTTILTNENSHHLMLKNMKCDHVGYNSSSEEQEDLGFLIKGNHITIEGCEISNSSGPTINIQGSDNVLINSYVHDGNYLGTFAGHAKISGRRQFISNNTMCESGRDVVSFRNLSESVIQYNDIYGAGRLTLDVGIMYTAETDGQNTLIHHNWIHDNYGNSNNNAGLYLDEMSHNFIAYSNVIWNTIYPLQMNQPSIYNLAYNNTCYNKSSLADTYTATFNADRGRQYINNYVSGKSDNSALAVDTFIKNNQAPSDAGFFNPSDHDFRISEKSSLANAGIVVSGVTKENPSIGAYEPNETFTVGHDFDNPPIIQKSPSIELFEYRNLISNGGFEYGSLENWIGSATVKESNAWHTTSNIAATDIYGVVLQPNQKISQTVKVDPNTVYTLALLARSNSGSVISFGIKDTNYQNKKNVSGTKWSGSCEVALEFRTDQKDAITVEIENVGSNELYLDDIGLQKNIQIIKDLSKEIKAEYNKEDSSLSLIFDELEEGHEYYYYNSASREAPLKKGDFVVVKPDVYANKLKSHVSLPYISGHYIHIVEVYNDKVIGISSARYVDDTNFFDGFRNFDNWVPRIESGVQKGTPSNTTEYSKSGRYSYVLDETMDVIEKKFNAPHNDIVTVWMYDNMNKSNGVAGVVNVTRQLEDGTSGFLAAGVSAKTGDLDHYAVREGSQWFKTNITRTKGWHELKFDYSNPGKCEIYIDGASVLVSNNAPYYNQIMIGDFWSDESMGSGFFFDDVTVGNPVIVENVVSITAQERQIKLNPNETYQLDVTAESEPDIDVLLKYGILDNNVATIDQNGLITALKSGTTKIIICPENSLEPKLEIELKVELDKTNLKELFETGLTYIKNDYTFDSWNTFKEAMLKADSELRNEKSTINSVNDSQSKLEKAMNDLVFVKENTLLEESFEIGELGEIYTYPIYAGDKITANIKESAAHNGKYGVELKTNAVAPFDPSTNTGYKSKGLVYKIENVKENDLYTISFWAKSNDSKNHEMGCVIRATGYMSELTTVGNEWKLIKVDLPAIESDYIEVIMGNKNTNENAGTYFIDDVIVTKRTQPNSIEGITLSDTSKTLQLDNHLTLTPTFTPNDFIHDIIAWSSSDETIINVENGVVTAKKVGNAIVTGRTLEGNYQIQCQITVTDNSALLEIVENANKIEKDLYTTESWNSFTRVLNEVKTILTKEDATQDILDEAYTSLDTAIKALIYKKADYSAVDAVIAKANQLNKDDYKDFSGVEKAIGDVIRDLDITKQAEVDTMAKAVEDAINALVKNDSGEAMIDK